VYANKLRNLHRQNHTMKNNVSPLLLISVIYSK